MNVKMTIGGSIGTFRMKGLGVLNKVLNLPKHQSLKQQKAAKIFWASKASKLKKGGVI